MVLTDWGNTGRSPVRAVYAEITAYGAAGNELASGAKSVMIYGVSNDSKGIAPGRTYVEPEDEGFVLAPDLAGGELAQRVQVTITKVKEQGVF